MSRSKITIICVVLAMLLFTSCHSSTSGPQNQDNQNQDNPYPKPVDEILRNINEGGSIQVGNPPIAMLAAKNLTVEGQSISAGQLPVDAPQISELTSDPNIAFAEFKVKWDPPDNAPVSYEVERKVGNLGEYQQVAKVVPPKTDAVEYGGPGATNYYRIKSIDANGNYGYSEEKKLRVKAPCEYPSGFVMVFPAHGCEPATPSGTATFNPPFTDLIAFNNTLLLGKGGWDETGMVTIDTVTGKWTPVDAFRNIDVNKMVLPKPSGKVYVATSAGLFWGSPGETWEKVPVNQVMNLKYISMSGIETYVIQSTDYLADSAFRLLGDNFFVLTSPTKNRDKLKEYARKSQSQLAVIAGFRVGGRFSYDTLLVGDTGHFIDAGLPKTTASVRINYRSVSKDFTNLVQKKEANRTVTYCLYRQTDAWRETCDDKYRALAWIDEKGKELYGNPDGGFEVTAAAVTANGEIWAIGNESYIFRFSE